MLYQPRRSNPWVSAGRPLVHRLARQLRRWWELREAAHRLEGLDDHLLSDAGVRREEIRTRVRGRH